MNRELSPQSKSKMICTIQLTRSQTTHLHMRIFQEVCSLRKNLLTHCLTACSLSDINYNTPFYEEPVEQKPRDSSSMDGYAPVSNSELSNLYELSSSKPTLEEAEQDLYV